MQAGATQPLYLDVRLEAGEAFNTLLPEAHNAFVYVYDGAISTGRADKARVLKRGELGVLGSRPDFRRSVRRTGNARFSLVAGHPLREPVARYGPFVMNTAAEIRQAMIDYQSGRL